MVDGRFLGYQLKAGQTQGLTVRPELVEGWTIKPFMVRQAHHERLNLILSRLKLVAAFYIDAKINIQAKEF